jgi:hypothetical protein
MVAAPGTCSKSLALIGDVWFRGVAASDFSGMSRTANCAPGSDERLVVDVDDPIDEIDRGGSRGANHLMRCRIEDGVKPGPCDTF